ncbi:MAG: 3-deoxy-7-phosphoheptulonate synthase [Planctomycetota bacterium]
MIVVMNPTATKDQIAHVVDLVHDMGLKDHVVEGTDLTVVAVLGDETKFDGAVLERADGVDNVMRVQKPYKLAARETKPANDTTVVTIGDHCPVGGTNVPVIAGPCSVEGEQEIIDAAHACKNAGAHALRGGAFKPRTNPYSFQGFGEDGLKMLAAARDATGLPIVTEVVTTEDVELVAQYADCLQIGTRNAQNFKLLEACGRQPKPVMLKRGMSMTIDEYLQAAEYLLAHGNPNVILCERGIRTFENHTRNTLPLATVPELHRRTHLPVIVDPSHGTGHAYLVPDMAKAAIAAGADALIIEVHPVPEQAKTDGAQTISPETMAELMPILEKLAAAIDRTCLSPVAV